MNRTLLGERKKKWALKLCHPYVFFIETFLGWLVDIAQETKVSLKEWIV